jgi:hypothetical protein
MGSFPPATAEEKHVTTFEQAFGPDFLRRAARHRSQELRTNSKKTKGNARGSDDDRRQIIADLISNDDSPFTPDDLEALNMARPEILQMWRDQYLKKAKAAADEDEEDDEEVTRENIAKLVANVIGEALAGLGIRTNTPPRSSWTKDDQRREKIETDARNLLRGLGIAKPTDDQVREMVETIIAKLDSGDGAEPGTFGAGEIETMANDAERRGNVDHARKLRQHAAGVEAHRRANAFQWPQPRLEAVRTNADDPDVKAMEEFHGPAASTRAIANKRRD